MRKYPRQLPGGFHENSWLTFCGATCSHSKLQVASGPVASPAGGTPTYTGNLDRKSPRAQAGRAWILSPWKGPAPHSPTSAQNWPPTPPLLPTSLFFCAPGKAGGQARRD